MICMGVGLHLRNSARGGAAHALWARITDRLLKTWQKILKAKWIDGLESLTFSNRHCFQLEGGGSSWFPPLFEKSYVKP